MSFSLFDKDLGFGEKWVKAAAPNDPMSRNGFFGGAGDFFEASIEKQ